MLYYALVGAIIYTLYGIMSYMDDWKALWWYIPVGLGLSMLGNLLWLFYVKSENNPTIILTNGAIWDTMISICFMVSILFTNKSLDLSTSTVVGAGITLIGLIIMKVGI